LHLATDAKDSFHPPNPEWGKAMKRKCLEHESCPVAKSLEAVGDLWSLLIVRDAFFGKRRFGDFLKSLGIARNILTARLKKLVEHGVLEQVPASDGSTYQEYVLTEKARGLYLVVIALRQWALGCMKEGNEPMLVDQKKGEPIRPLELRAKDGRVLGPNDIRLVPASKG
jgi:DNA-binding HxlR family transcriptional regulator